MIWTDANTRPHAILTETAVIALIATGQEEGFMWAWDGTDDKILVWPGATMDPEGRLIDRGDNRIGFVAPMADMPEVPDIGAATAFWQRGRQAFDEPHFQGWLEAELKMHRR